MRGGSTRYIRRFGTSISVERCCTWDVIRKHWAWLETCSRRAPYFAFGHARIYTAATLAQLGRLEEARAALPGPQGAKGYASIGEILRAGSYLASIERDQLIEGLRKAGFPE
jgi:hypothetical protein